MLCTEVWLAEPIFFLPVFLLRIHIDCPFYPCLFSVPLQSFVSNTFAISCGTVSVFHSSVRTLYCRIQFACTPSTTSVCAVVSDFLLYVQTLGQPGPFSYVEELHIPISACHMSKVLRSSAYVSNLHQVSCMPHASP